MMASQKMCLYRCRANLVTSWKDDNPRRRFLSCPLWQSGRGCGFFEWYDPVMCKRSRVIIPGLLRKLNEKEADIERLK
ncbi:hypothetical protein ACH5RR_036075 [Cinchona calisaya]|uniref:GRF-type domain-containing protein n=1 Tax=Cinchona calisaya TaxID=153742 RepID=A0ABD2Y4K0_9GENT